MIIQLILTPIWAIINGLIALLGGFFGEFSWSVGNFDVLLDLLGYGVYFFGTTTFCMVVSTKEINTITKQIQKNIKIANTPTKFTKETTQ